LCKPREFQHLERIRGTWMQPVIARCGNRCDLCPLFHGNFRAEEVSTINEGLYKYHHRGKGPRPQYEAGCDGCLSDGYGARQGCRIRACAIENGLSTCSRCPQLYCELLEKDMAIIEGALAQEGASLPLSDFDRFFRPFLNREALARLRQNEQPD
jgi:hypothetical protein